MAATIEVVFAGNTAGLDRAFNQVNGTAGKTQTAMGRVAGAIGGLAVARKAAGYLKEAGTASSNLQQSVGATESVFGSAAGVITAFGKTSADTVGLSTRAFNEGAAKIGAMLQNLGASQQEAADGSVELTKRAADMAATFGGPTSDALDAISAGLRGELDPLERYGVKLSAASVEAKALALGLVESGGKMDDNAKRTATLALLTEQTANVTGQFAREADTAAGAQARQQAQSENTAASLGKSLLPITTKVYEVVGLIGKAFSSLPGPVQTGVVALVGVTAAASSLNNILGSGGILNTVGTKLIPMIKVGLLGALNMIMAHPIVAGIALIVGALVFLERKFGVVSTAIGWLGDKFSWLLATGQAVFRALPTAIRSGVNALIAIVEGAINAITWPSRQVGRLINMIPGVNLPIIPEVRLARFHAGGVVPGSPTSETLALLRGGERVMSSPNMGGGGQGIVINIQGSVVAERDLARTLSGVLAGRDYYSGGR